MSHSSPQQKVLCLGTITLGARSLESADMCKIIFKCRKGKFDYLGQIKINATDQTLRIEWFNKNYFSLFAGPRNHITASLENQLLKILGRCGKIQDPFRAIVRSRTTNDIIRPTAELNRSTPMEKGVDLQTLFDQLNELYFQGKIKANIEWGNGYGKRNRRSFRFGSYDLKKKVIQINPALKQEFVPPAVLEMTIYHEMCHQYFSPIRKKGQWKYHHAEFKKKEREHPHYREVHLWEKKYWTKLLTV